MIEVYTETDIIRRDPKLYTFLITHNIVNEFLFCMNNVHNRALQNTYWMRDHGASGYYNFNMFVWESTNRLLTKPILWKKLYMEFEKDYNKIIPFNFLKSIKII